MATQFTQYFRLNKPDFRSSPWADQLNENADRLDDIIYNTLQASNVDTYTNNVEVNPGQIMYDPEQQTFWLNRVSHTTLPSGTFANERIIYPTYWTSVQFGINPKGQWARNTPYAYYDLAYDTSEGLSGLCLIPHTSPNTGTMRDEADKWVFLIDTQQGGGADAASISFNDTDVPFDASNVQVAVVETNDRISALQTDAPTDLNTFVEVAAAINNDPDFAGSVAAAIDSSAATRETIGVAAGINTQIASYTLALSDKGKTVRMNSASSNNLTIPPNSSVAFPIGTYVNWRQVGVGVTFIVAGSGVTLNKRVGLKSLGQHAGGTLQKVDTNTWDVYGELEA